MISLSAGICNSSPGLYDITLQATWHKEDDRSIGFDFRHVRSICYVDDEEHFV